MRAVTHVLALSEKPGKIVWAGAERHLRVLLPALVRAGVDVEAIVLSTNAGATIQQGIAEWTAAGVRVVVVDRHSSRGRLQAVPGFIRQHLRLWTLLRRRRARAVHLHLDLVLMVVAAIAARCPHVVVTLHNEVLSPRSHAAAALWRAWLRRVARRVSHFIAISPRVRDRFCELAACPPGKITVVEYGYATPPRSALRREDLGWPNDRFLVGFVGRLVPEKNPFVLLEAMAHNVDMDLIVVGDGPLRADVEAFIAQRGLRNVHLAGPIEDASRLIPLFDVLCLPSRWEGLGLVLVEAMLQRTPIIGSRCGAIPDVLGDGRYGLLFDADDAGELAAMLRFARENPAAMTAQADRAFDYAGVRFSVATMTERTAAIYGGTSVSAAPPMRRTDEIAARTP